MSTFLVLLAPMEQNAVLRCNQFGVPGCLVLQQVLLPEVFSLKAGPAVFPYEVRLLIQSTTVLGWPPQTR